MDDGDADVDDDPSAMDESARDARIDRLRALLPQLDGHYGRSADVYLKAKAELDTLERARQDAKPLKTQQLAVERRLEKKRRAVAAADKKRAELADELTELHRRIKEADDEAATMAAELRELEAEHKAVLRRALQGGDEVATPSMHAAALEALRVASLAEAAGNVELQQQINSHVAQLRNFLASIPPPSTPPPPNRQRGDDVGDSGSDGDRGRRGDD